MQIKNSKELDSFFDRCWKNIQNDSQNSFLGKRITPSNEQYIKKQLLKNGNAELKNNPGLSLFISSNDWVSSPYHTSIHLDTIQDDHFSYRTEVIKGNELFNYSSIQKDPNRELNDYMMLRALDKDVSSIYLLQDEVDWMLDAPSEAMTNDPVALKAHGNVITFGLGIGYFPFMCMQNKNVTSITVVEKSKELVDMFMKFIYPQFPQNIPLKVISGDAYDYYNEETLNQYDFIYSDIWRSNDDGLECITKLLEQYHNLNKDIHFWIEDSCVEIIWALIFVYFDEIYHHRQNTVPEFYDIYMQKIRKYFEQIEKVITDCNDLKNYMYDTNTIREILAISLTR